VRENAPTLQSLPNDGTGKHRQEDCHLPAQTRLALIDPQESLDKIADTYDVLRKAVGVYGGRKLLALELGREVDYEAKIANGLNRRDDRHAFVDWLVPLLKHPEAGALLIEWFCALSGFERPKRRPIASDGELLGSLMRVLVESGPLGDDVVKRAAARLGVDVASFKK
jgi:hypothetical protein